MTSNGNAFHAFIEDAVSFLSNLESLDYFRQPLQSEADMGLFDIVAGYRTADVQQRTAFAAELDDTQRAILALFAHRAATIAVRLGSAAWLENAMLASTIANAALTEPRRVDAQLAILYHCARLLNLSPVTLFDWAATYAADPLAAHLEAFGRREDVVLKDFGWAEQRTREGIKFSASWQ